MGAFLVASPYPVFTDADGTPLEDGYIYLGGANTNPEILANQIAVYWDSALTQPAAQPIRTVGGYASRNGSPGILYVIPSTFSITLRDRNLGLVLSTLSGIPSGVFQANNVAYTPVGGSSSTLDVVLNSMDVESVHALITGTWTGITNVTTKSFYPGWAATVAGPKGRAIWHHDGTTGGVQTTDTTAAIQTAILAGKVISADGKGWVLSKQVFTPAQVGVQGDDTDETTGLKAIFAAAAGSPLEMEYGKTYRTTDTLILPANTKLNLNGSTLKFVITGSTNCLDPRSGASVDNGSITLAGSAYAGHGGNGCPIIVGDYGAGTGYGKVKLTRLTITSNKTNGNGIFITGNSYQVDVDDITFADSATLGRGVCVHWGGATAPASGTYHPHNIRIRNIKADNQTYMSTTSDGIVFLSGTYNVLVENIAGDNVGCGVLFYAGDYGTQYAGATVGPKINEGIKIRNITLTNVTHYGVYINSIGSSGGAAYKVRTPVVAENVVLTGSGASAKGFYLGTCDGTMWKNCEASLFPQHGFEIARTCFNGRIEGGRYYSNGINGIRFYDTTDTNTDWEVTGAYIYSNNTAANANPYDKAGIGLRNGKRVRIKNCVFGVAAGETQFYSVRGELACDTLWVSDNHTIGIAAGGVCYSFGASTDYTLNPVGGGNTAVAGVTLYSGCPIFTYDGNGNRSFKKSAAPVGGAWIVGDRAINITPTVGQPKAWVCTVAGTPGTWVSEGNL